MQFVSDGHRLEVVKPNPKIAGDWFCRSTQCDTGLWSYAPATIMANACAAESMENKGSAAPEPSVVPATTHKNRKGQSPSPGQVKAIREAVQEHEGCGITAAQDWCAERLYTSRRAFQQWEAGEAAMHQAFWELLRIKTAHIALAA
jgi:DNA-binding transcriptional regulator YiaG